MITVDVDSLDDFIILDSKGERYRLIKENEIKEETIQKTYINQVDIIKIYKTSYNTIYKLCEQKLLNPIVVGGFTRYEVSELKKLEEQGKLKRRPLA